MICLLCAGESRAGEGAPKPGLSVWYWSVPGQRPAQDSGLRPDRVYVEAGHALAATPAGQASEAKGPLVIWRITSRPGPRPCRRAKARRDWLGKTAALRAIDCLERIHPRFGRQEEIAGRIGALKAWRAGKAASVEWKPLKKNG